VPAILYVCVYKAIGLNIRLLLHFISEKQSVRRYFEVMKLRTCDL